ncbi:MAG: type IVB secretion system protein IcmG/DotF [Legionella sp.]|uniref:type IVB secretion system protein IcmG/DotF n=1 Tax=Legionella sp. TaxID=459 RepID=UPI0039E2E201
MADNDQNDEYKFAELDSYEDDSMDNGDFGSSEHMPSDMEPKPPKTDVRRNAMITIGLVVFAMIMYKILGGLFSGKNNNTAKGNIPSVPVTAQMNQQPQPPQPVQAEITPQPVQPVQQVIRENDPALTQKVNSIETNQQNMQSQVTSINTQVGNVNTNMTNLAEQITKLNQTISDLATQLNRQSEEINLLMERARPKQPIFHHHVRRYPYIPRNIYYINAVIPGRAWLIGTNGSTLTVREGTKIAGYGVVKLIDSMEGRILTSSGRVIRFSQEDS